MRARHFAFTVAVAGVLLAGCGDTKSTVPSDTVAVVDRTEISKQDFDRYLNIGIRAAAQQGPPEYRDITLDPPKFTKCTAQLLKVKPAAGAAKTTEAQAKQSCAGQYRALSDQALQTLITRQWIAQEADRLGITANDKEVDQSLQQQVKAQFPADGEFEKFLKGTGMTRQDMRERVYSDTLTRKVLEKQNPKPLKYTEAQLRAYYNKNRKRLSAPASRQTYVIVTDDRDQARRAAQALRDGVTPEKVVGKYSTDTATRQQGGQISFSEGMDSKKVDRLIDRAAVGEVVGPVKGNRGWLVFKVTGKRQPAYTPSFKQAKAQIAAQMNAERNGKAQQAWNKKFTARYKPKTLCAKGFELSAFCGNVKPPKLPDVEVSGAEPAPKPR